MKTDIQELQVFLYDQFIGILTRLPGDKILFTFDEKYIQNPQRPTLSLSFKDQMGELITDIAITRTRLPSFFTNLLPEGSLREYLAKRDKIDPQREFFFLWLLGQDLPGALTIRANAEIEEPLKTWLPTWKSEEQHPLRFSLAGIQMKFSAIRKAGRGFLIPSNGIGGRWIVKLPHSIFLGIPENEYSMMELARRVGIDVPEIALHPLEELQGLPKEFQHLDRYAYAIRRFDRTDSGEKIHIEDFPQVFGVYPEKKYTSANYRNIVQVIAAEAGDEGVEEFIRRFVFNVLIGNGDMHLKNWSLIYREKNKPKLAPAYDFVSTIPYLPEDKLALNFVGDKDFRSLTLAQFKRFAMKAKLSEEFVMNTVQATVQAFIENWKWAGDLPLQKEVQTIIGEHLKRLPFYEEMTQKNMVF